MLKQPLLENLTRLRLPGFREGLKEQWENPHYAELPFDERLGLLVDLECTRRDNSSLERRIKAARFILPAVSKIWTSLPFAAWTAASSWSWPRGSGSATI